MRYITSILLTLAAISAQAVVPTLQEMETIISMDAWEEVNEYLKEKQWVYDNSENIGRKETEMPLYYISWKQNAAMVSMTTDGTAMQKPASVLYTTKSDAEYKQFTTALSAAGYRQTKQEDTNQKSRYTYRTDKYLATIVENYDAQGTVTSRVLAISAKGSPYDSENGVKFSYDNNGLKMQSYTMTDGEKNGPFATYYTNGNTKLTINYNKGVYSGPFKAYNEDGQLVIESYIENGNSTDTTTVWEYENGIAVREMTGNFDINYSTDEQGAFSYALKSDGEVHYTETIRGEEAYGYYRMKDGKGQHVKHHVNGQLLDSTQIALQDGKIINNGSHNAYQYVKGSLEHEEHIDYVMGQLDGDYQVIDYNIETPSGHIGIELSGTYIAGQKNGMFTQTQLRDGKHYIVQYTTYNQDTKQGSFMERNGCITTVGNYSDNQLSGAILYYVDSAIINAPTIENYLSVGKLKLLETGTWGIGQKCGTWVRMQDGDTIKTSYALDLWRQSEYVLHDNTTQRIVYTKTVDGMTCTLSDAMSGRKIRETEYLVTDPLLIDQLNNGSKAIIREEQLARSGWDRTYDEKGQPYIFHFIKNGIETFNDRYYPDQNLKVNTDQGRGYQYFTDTKTNEAYSGKVTIDTDDPKVLETASIKDGVRNGSSTLIDRETKKKISKEKYKNGVAE